MSDTEREGIQQLALSDMFRLSYSVGRLLLYAGIGICAAGTLALGVEMVVNPDAFLTIGGIMLYPGAPMVGLGAILVGIGRLGEVRSVLKGTDSEVPTLKPAEE